jgi:hypothetical protein
MAKMTNAILQFSESSEDMKNMFIAFEDLWHHYRSNLDSRDRYAKKFEYDSTKSLPEKEDKLNKLMIKNIVARSGVNYAREDNLGEWFLEPRIRFQTFALVGSLIDMILPETVIDSIGLYTSVENIGWGDSASFEIKPSDLFTVSKSGKNQRHAEVKKQYNGLVTVIPEMREITVAVNLYKVLAGKESLAEFTMKAVKSLETRVTLDAYTLFAATMAAINSTTTTGLQVTTGYTQAALVRICQQVEAWNFGAKPVIVGTQLALSSVLPDDANYRYFLDNSEYATLGYVRTAFGYDTMVMPQVADFTTQFALSISNSYLWVISPATQKLLKLVFEGNTISFTDDSFDNSNTTIKSTLKKAYGLGLATNAVAGVIDL